MNATDTITYRLTAQSEEATMQLAAQLAGLCRAADAVLLQGDVGMGKTTFARAFIRSISPEKGEITSPTFNLLQTYPLNDGGTLWHFDLYRLKHRDELIEIGLHEALEEGITLIEWPELARSDIPETALEVTMKSGSDHSQRLFEITGLATCWSERLNLLKEAVSA